MDQDREPPPLQVADPETAGLREDRPPALYLVYWQGHQHRSFELVPGVESVVGRSPTADLVLNDRECSQEHARISGSGEAFQILDLTGENGVSLNGAGIREAELAAGDELILGATRLSVSTERPHDDATDLLPGRPFSGSEAGRGARPTSFEGDSARRVPLMAIGAAALLVAALIFLWRSGDDSGEGGAGDGLPTAVAGDELKVQVMQVSASELIAAIDVTGSVRPHQSVTVSAEVSAKAERVAIDEGAVVSAGDLLIALEGEEIRLQIEEASSAVSQEQVDLARQDYERKERLFAQGAVIRSAVDQAKNSYLGLDSSYRSAQAKIAQLSRRLEKTRITAPIAGTVTGLSVDEGEFVSAGSALIVLDDTSEVLVEVEVSDRDVVRVSRGQAVEVRTAAFPERVFSGVVERVGSAANPVSRAFELEARIDNGDSSLRSGMIASLRVILGRTSGVVIPEEAVIADLAGDAQVLVVSDGVVHRTPVRLGQRRDRQVEVLEGLVAGQQIVVYGSEGLEDGQRVKAYLP